MLRRVTTVIALMAIVLAVFAQAGSADPVNAKKSQVFVANCGGSPNFTVSVNGSGAFTPAHVIGSTAVFIPTAFNLTATFTPIGGSPQSEAITAAKAHQPSSAVTCNLPEGRTPSRAGRTFTISGTVTGFFTPAN